MEPALLYLLVAAQEEEDQHRRLAGLAIAGAVYAQEIRRERRYPRRTYLTRSDLLPNPRAETPWTRLHESGNDRAFIATMGFDVATFNKILDAGFGDRWTSSPVPRPDTSTGGAPRPHVRSLDAAGALGLALHYLNSTMTERSLQQIFATTPATTSRYLDFALDILSSVLQKIPEAKIVWPDSIDRFQHLSSLFQLRHPLLDGAFAVVDGWKTPILASADPEIENMNYNGWQHEHFVSSVAAFDSEGVIIACQLNAPGSWHDSRVARPIYNLLIHSTPPGFYLLGDTAFPRAAAALRGRIKAPLKSGQRLPSNRAEKEEVLAFNRQLVSARQAAEWGMRALQATFGRIRMPMDANNTAGRSRILQIVVRLHNLRTRVVGINQIRSVYMPVWQESPEEMEVWNGFENLIFGEMRRHDRVAKFHVVAADL